MSDTEWAAGPFTIRSSLLGSTEVLEIEIAGWLKGLFALDFRVWDDDEGDPYLPGWQLTHLPTGFSVCGINSCLTDAKAIADEIATAADWDFTDAADAKSRAASFYAVKDRHPDTVIRGTAHFGPLSFPGAAA